MPKIHYFLITCPGCGAQYKVRIEKVEERQPVECLTCGEQISLAQFGETLKAIYDYSKVIIDLENQGKLEEDVFVPKGKALRLNNLGEE